MGWRRPRQALAALGLALRVAANQHTQIERANSGLQAGRIGLRGVEDLGAGLAAVFWLEGELRADNDQLGGFDFVRRSILGLRSRTLGGLRPGRDKVPTTYVWDEFDPFRDAGIGRSTRLSVASGIVPGDGVYDTFSRASDAVGYLLPALSGPLCGPFGQAMFSTGQSGLGGSARSERSKDSRGAELGVRQAF